jgi:hypothetical protein
LFGLFFRRIGWARNKARLAMFHAQTVEKLAHLGRTSAYAGEFFDGVLRGGTGGGGMLAKMLC